MRPQNTCFLLPSVEGVSHELENGLPDTEYAFTYNLDFPATWGCEKSVSVA